VRDGEDRLGVKLQPLDGVRDVPHAHHDPWLGGTAILGGTVRADGTARADGQPGGDQQA